MFKNKKTKPILEVSLKKIFQITHSLEPLDIPLNFADDRILLFS